MGVKFIIIGAPRTGSTLLVRTLNRLDGICCHGELLQLAMVRGYEDGFDPTEASKSERDARMSRLLQERNRDPLGFMQKALSTENAATGFKALYRAFLEPDWLELIAALLADPDIRYLHLRRHNSLRRYVSERVFEAGGPIHSAAGGRSEVQVRVSIDIPTFLKRASLLQAEGNQVDAMLAGRKVHPVSYEELATDLSSTVAGVCQFLGLATRPGDIVPALRKVGAADLRDAVTNYDELLQHSATREMALAD